MTLVKKILDVVGLTVLGFILASPIILAFLSVGYRIDCSEHDIVDKLILSDRHYYVYQMKSGKRYQEYMGFYQDGELVCIDKHGVLFLQNPFNSFAPKGGKQ